MNITGKVSKQELWEEAMWEGRESLLEALWLHPEGNVSGWESSSRPLCPMTLHSMHR